ncbi:MAG: hypoxanthine phosphoribosyltransferase [Myxococcota bacterium]
MTHVHSRIMSDDWKQHVEVMYSAEQIAERIQVLGDEITRDFAGERVVLVGVLKGCFVFYSDLARAINLPQDNDFIGISSYGDNTESSGVVQLTTDLGLDVQGRNVVLVEDIVDTGLSMKYLLENLSTRKPASLSVCTLLDKPENRRAEVPIDYRGFEIPNEFVVGYGLDYAGTYRNLPFIGVYRGPT